MKIHFYRSCELLLGFIFLAAGVNGYIVLAGHSPLFPVSPSAMDFLANSYLLGLVKTTELICGALFLLHRYIPLALLITAPVIVNILAFHLFVDPQLLPLALLLFILEIILIWKYREHFKGLLVA
ncbi:hypothetical protein [Ammoniphilus sp. 3BR4]|uniref:hypothetical protein n=1 Tax=Ammoniphilus sp. 3BR4 TaxID=3158265 RepID=UPI0034677AD4